MLSDRFLDIAGQAVPEVPAIGHLLSGGRWPAVRATVDRATELAGSTVAPGRKQIEDFVTAQIHGPYGPLPFAGRDKEIGVLTSWFGERTLPPYYLVTGPAGIGKSTVLVRWALTELTQPDTDVVIVPISIRFDLTSQQEVLAALVHRLGVLHGESHDLSSGSTASLLQAASMLLRRPAPRHSLVVILDALDETDDWPRRLLPQRLGEGVQVLLSARFTGDRPNGSAWAQWLGVTNVSTLTLTPLEPAVMTDLITQVSRDDDAETIAVAAARLWSLTSGDPVTTVLHLQDVREHTDGNLTEWIASRRATPTGLAGFFEEWWLGQRRIWDEAGRSDDAERVLRVLACAEGPLCRVDLTELMARLPERLDGVRLDRALEALRRFVLPGVGGTVVIAHPTIVEMLRERLARTGGGEYRRVFTDWGVDVLARLGTKALAPADVPDYLIRHLAEHLSTAVEFHPSALELLKPFWRKAKDAISEDADGFRHDVTLIAEQARRLDRQRETCGEAARFIPEQVMCAAELAGERQTLGDRMTPVIAAMFVRHKLWKPVRGLGYIATYERNRSDGIAAIAPFVSVEHLPALENLVSLTLNDYPEQTAAAIAAWASRLLDLGFVAEALNAARIVPEGSAKRDLVTVWVLAGLIPRLPEDLAATALAAAFRAIFRSGPEITYSISRLTQAVSLRRAEELWSAVEAVLADTNLQSARTFPDREPRAALLAALGADQSDSPFLRRGVGFTDLQWRPFVAVARWLDGDLSDATILAFLGEASDYDLRHCGPDINYDGVLSVASSKAATHALAIVRDRLDGKDRLCALAQLLPLLDDDLRRSTADELFHSPRDDMKMFIKDLNMIIVALPALLAAGEGSRLVTLMNDFPDAYWFTRMLAPSLTHDQTAAALTTISPSADWRKYILARWASFGAREASQVLDEVHAIGPDDSLSPDLLDRLSTYLTEELSYMSTSDMIYTWWAYTSRSHYWPDIGPVGFHGRRHQWGEDELLRALLDDDPIPYSTDLLTVAVDLTVSIRDHHVPYVVRRARSLSDPWQALVLLAAATHLKSDTIMEEIRSILARLRAHSETVGSSSKWGMHW